MRQPLTFVCDRDQDLGLRLLGLPAIAAVNGAAATRKLEGLLGAGRAGVVVVARRLWKALPLALRKRLDESSSPFFIDLPLAETGPPAEDEDRARAYVSARMEEAIGQRIKIGETS